MQREGQLVFVGKFYLQGKYVPLSVSVRQIVVVIQPDLSDGYYLGVYGKPRHFPCEVVAIAFALVGVHSDSGEYFVVFVGEAYSRKHRGHIAAVVDDELYVRRAAVFYYSVDVVCKSWIVQVKVSVYHLTSLPLPMSFSGVTNTTLFPSAAHSIIPFDSTPRIFAGFRLDTNTTVLPSIYSGE